MGAFLLALDQGTTSSRAIVFSAEGEIVGMAQREFRQIFPEGSGGEAWVEHDPMEIYRSQVEVAREAVAAAGIDGREIAAVGIANQRETTVVWERATGRPVCNAIVWQDRRTAGRCLELARDEAVAAMIGRKTGLVPDAYFSASKVEWILRNVPGARERAGRGELCFGTVDSWLLWNLTGGPRGGVHATDLSNASRTMLLDILRGEWDEELLRLFGVPREMLPEVRGTVAAFGETTELVEGVQLPIGAMAGDQQAALFGQGCLRAGMAKCTYGTGCFLLMNTGPDAVVSRNRLLTTVAWGIGKKQKARSEKQDGISYALEGAVFVGGAVVQWLRDGLGIIKSAGEVEALARSVSDTGGVYVVPAFAGLGAPHWDAFARGTIVGITRGTTKGHIARAALEGIAFQVADLLEAMEADVGKMTGVLRVDGGAAGNDLLMQMQADLLQVPVVRPAVLETTALGAAKLAGLAVGVEVRESGRGEKRFVPVMGEGEARQKRERWQEALGRAKGWSQS